MDVHYLLNTSRWRVQPGEKGVEICSDPLPAIAAAKLREQVRDHLRAKPLLDFSGEPMDSYSVDFLCGPAGYHINTQTVGDNQARLVVTGITPDYFREATGIERTNIIGMEGAGPSHITI